MHNPHRQHTKGAPLTTSHLLLRLLDLTLLGVHGSLVIFNASGWAWKRTRRLHLWTASATVASWFGLGAAFGWGYCPLTDWHWRIKAALGETGLPASWVKYYLDRLTGMSWDPTVVDAVVGTTGAVALALAVALAARDRIVGQVPAPRPATPPRTSERLGRSGLRRNAGIGKVQARRAVPTAPTSDTEEE